MIKRICKICNKEFFVWECLVRKGGGLYCSYKCNGKARIGSKHTKDYKIKMRNMRLGNKNPFYGKKHTILAKKTMSIKRTGKYYRKHFREKTSKMGYTLVYSPNHPNRRIDGYILKHRLIMEKLLKRYLKKSDVIHHIDKNLSNNEITNLKLFKNQQKHIEYHTINRKRDSKGRLLKNQ